MGNFNIKQIWQVSEFMEKYSFEKDNCQIGGGAYGNIFKATRKTDNQEVAIKHIAKDKLVDEDSLNDLYNEVSILLDVDHVNIVKYFETY
jgi:serine/threonine protein kinase